MAKSFGFESTTDEVLEEIDLSGKRVVVTGVSAGLCVETARALVAHGGGLGTSARYRFSSENRNSSCRIDCSSASIVRRCSSGHDSIPLAEACAECQALFGASTPAAKLLLGNLSPLMLSALLYLGAAIALSACRF